MAICLTSQVGSGSGRTRLVVWRSEGVASVDLSAPRWARTDRLRPCPKRRRGTESATPVRHHRCRVRAGHTLTLEGCTSRTGHGAFRATRRSPGSDSEYPRTSPTNADDVGDHVSHMRRATELVGMWVFPLLKSLLPVVVAFLLPTTDTLDHRRVGNGTHRHGLFQEPMEELPAMA